MRLLYIFEKNIRSPLELSKKNKMLKSFLENFIPFSNYIGKLKTCLVTWATQHYKNKNKFKNFR